MSAEPLDLFDLLPADLPVGRPYRTDVPFYGFDNGDNDPMAIPVQALARLASEVISEEGQALAYYHLGGSPLGWLPLRHHLAERLKARGSAEATPDHVLVLNGSTQGLDIVNALMLRAGDCVLVEAHSYSAALTRFKGLNLRIEPVALDAEGIDTVALALQLERLKGQGIKPRLLYTIPTIQNPTGSILPLQRRLELVALARAHAVVLFEDECYAELAWQDDLPPSLFSLAPDVCIHLGSLSKTLAPALRLGFLAAEPKVISALLTLKRDGGTSGLPQLIAARFLDSLYLEHVARLRGELAAKCDHMMEAVAREFGTVAEVERPKGGMFIWLRLDPAIDVGRLQTAALSEGISFNAGADWSVVAREGQSMIRLCFAAPDLVCIDEGIARLAQVSQALFGLPLTRANQA